MVRYMLKSVTTKRQKDLTLIYALVENKPEVVATVFDTFKITYQNPLAKKDKNVQKMIDFIYLILKIDKGLARAKDFDSKLYLELADMIQTGKDGIKYES